MHGKWWVLVGVLAAVGLPIVAWLVLYYGTWPQAIVKQSPAGRAAAASKLYVANAFGDDVQAFDLETGAAVARIRVGKLPRGLTADGKVVYVAEAGAQAIAAIDATTDKLFTEHIVGTVSASASHQRAGIEKVRLAANCSVCHPGKVVGSEPGAPVLGPDGKLYLAELLGAQLSQVERPSLLTRRTIEVAKGSPLSVLFHPVTRDAYVVSRTVTEPRTTIEQGAGSSGHSGIPWLDGPTDGTGWLSVYDPDLQTLRWRLELPGSGAHQAVFSLDGAELYVTLRGTDKVAVVDVAKHVVSRSYKTGSGPAGILLLPPDTLAVTCFNARPGELQLIDRKTGVARRTVIVPDNPVELARHPVTGRVYVAASGANKVVEIDPDAGTVLRTFNTGAAPVAVAVVP